MTSRHFVIAWSVALVLTLGSLAVGHRAVSRGMVGACPDSGHEPQGSAIVIGSSLTLYAFAKESSAAGPLADLQIWAMANLRPETALRLTRCAVEQGYKIVFLEANTFALRPNVTPDKIADTIASRIDLRLIEFTHLMSALSRSGPALLSDNVSSLHEGRWNGTRPEGARLPAGIMPTIWLDRVREAASTNDGRLVLFEPPRTHLQNEEFARVFGTPLPALLKALGDRTGLPVLRVWPGWDDSFFNDFNSHLNKKGRARFAAEFRAAWGRMPDAN